MLLTLPSIGDRVNYIAAEIYTVNHLSFIKKVNMLPESALRRSADSVVNYIQKSVILAGAERKEEVLELFDQMYQFFPHWVIMTCPIMHPDICYVSKNATHIFGYNSEQMLQNCKAEYYSSLVNEDDRADLHDCYAQIHELLESIPPNEHQVYRTLLHYRFKKANGEFMYLHDERATLTLRGGENLYYGLNRDLTEEKPFTGVKLEIFRHDQVMKKIKEYKPASFRNSLSKREMELVTLIKQGFSGKEIAGQLNISHNTVRNIKSKMFEKYRVSNTIELLNVAG
jgi:DNA-binding CsgD family transcriptional regulator/PAS domain-containing protein